MGAVLCMSSEPAKVWLDRVGCRWCVCRQGASKANAAVQWVFGHKSADSEMPQNATGSREVLHSALLSRRLHKGDVTMLQLCRSRSTPAPYQPTTQGTLPQWQQLGATRQL